MDNPDSAAAVRNVIVEVEGREYAVLPDATGRFTVEHQVSRSVVIPSTHQVKATYGDGEIVKVASFEVPPATVEITPKTGLPCDEMSLTVEGMPVYAELSALTIGGFDVIGERDFRTDRNGAVTVDGLPIPVVPPGTHSVVVRIGGAVSPTTATSTLTVLPYTATIMAATPTLEITSGAASPGGYFDLRVEGIQGYAEITAATIAGHDVLRGQEYCVRADRDNPITAQLIVPGLDPGNYPVVVRINAGVFQTSVISTLRVQL